MGQFTLTWDNSPILLNSNATAQKASYRLKRTGGAYISTGFTPSNNMSKSITTAQSPALLDNNIYEFIVETICVASGPTLNSNSAREAINFACIDPILTKTQTTGTITLDVSNTDITKAKFTLYNHTDGDSLVFNQVTIPRIGNNIICSAASLIPNNEYFWVYEIFTTINGNEVSSYDTGYIESSCEEYYFTTDTVVVVTCDAITNLVCGTISASSTEVGWTASPTAVNGYLVFYRPTANPTWVSGGTTILTTTTLLGLIPNTNYSIKVVSLCASGATSDSEIIQVNTLTTSTNLICGETPKTRNVVLGTPVTETWELGCMPNTTTIDYVVNSIGSSEKLSIQVLYDGIVLTSMANLVNGNSGSLTFAYNPIFPLCSVDLIFTVTASTTGSNMLVLNNDLSGNGAITDINVGGTYPYIITSGAFPMNIGDSIGATIGTGTFIFSIYHTGTTYPKTIEIVVNSVIIETLVVPNIGNNPKLTSPVTLSLGDTIEFILQ